jgi:predicted NACHT family NTPase
LALAFAIDRASKLLPAMERVLIRTLDIATNFELRYQIQELKKQLPNTSWESREGFKLWWKIQGHTWEQSLYQTLIQHSNIGHDWQFTDAQKALLQQYYDANLLLIECLNSDCYVSRSVREEIEATLLLPMSELRN